MEQWKDIKGYEGLYQISNLGNVKRDGKILKPGNSKIWYLTVSLWKNNIGKTFCIHRLIAEYFILNPENKKTVNHKNGIRTDNRIENLEWSTYSENNLHSYRILGKKGAKSQAIVCSNGKQYESLRQAARELNTDKANIARVCKGEARHAKGYQFKYAS